MRTRENSSFGHPRPALPFLPRRAPKDRACLLGLQTHVQAKPPCQGVEDKPVLEALRVDARQAWVWAVVEWAVSGLQVPAVGSLWRDKDSRMARRVVRIVAASERVTQYRTTNLARLSYTSERTYTSRTSRFLTAFERVEEPRGALDNAPSKCQEYPVLTPHAPAE
jgi:hypothetical protein